MRFYKESLRLTFLSIVVFFVVSWEMGYPPLMWKIRYSLGQIYYVQGKTEIAEAEIEKAIKVIEKMASNVSDSEVKETFLASEPIQRVYKKLTAL